MIPYRLPIMRTVSLTARIADTGGTIPDIAGARVQMGASDLSLWVPGLKLDTAEITIPALDQSARGEFLGTLNGVPVRLQASLGALANFLPERAATEERFPVDIALDLGETSLSIKGAIGAVGPRSGLNLAVAGRVRDLELLAPLAGMRLPRMRNIEFAVGLGDGAPAGFAESIALRALSVTAPPGDITGELILAHTPRWALTGRLDSTNLDADALFAALTPAFGTPALVEPRSPFYRPSWDDTRIIPTDRLRLDLLRHADADLQITIGALRAIQTPYSRVLGRLRLAGGRLDIDPLLADLVAGQATLALQIDASDPNRPQGTPIRLRAAIPGLPVQPLFAATSRRDNLFGALEIDADLTAEGDTLRALGASVSGRLGLSIVEGDIDSRLLLAPLANIMGAARVPLNLATMMGTLARLRCFAVRLDADHGQTRIAGMVLESGRVLIEGEGGFDLGAETLALRLRSSIRIPGQGVSVPSRLYGSFAAPQMELELPDPARVTTKPDSPDPCPPALALARAGRAGPMPFDPGARPALVAPPARPRPRR